MRASAIPKRIASILVSYDLVFGFGRIFWRLDGEVRAHAHQRLFRNSANRQHVFDVLERPALRAEIDDRFCGRGADAGDRLPFRGGRGIQVDRIRGWMFFCAWVE